MQVLPFFQSNNKLSNILNKLFNVQWIQEWKQSDKMANYSNYRINNITYEVEKRYSPSQLFTCFLYCPVLFTIDASFNMITSTNIEFNLFNLFSIYQFCRIYWDVYKVLWFYITNKWHSKLFHFGSNKLYIL